MPVPKLRATSWNRAVAVPSAPPLASTLTTGTPAALESPNNSGLVLTETVLDVDSAADAPSLKSIQAVLLSKPLAVPNKLA